MKKLLSLLICTVLVFSLVASLAMTVGATGRTADEAIAWVRSKVGTGIDYDGVYGCQCVDLIKAYFNYLGVSPIAANGADYAWKTMPFGWSRIQGGVPQKGDILVYTGGTYGHVAIFELTYSHFHQNYNGHSYVENVTKHSYNWSGSNYWGCIHPNFANNGTVDVNAMVDGTLYAEGIPGTFDVYIGGSLVSSQVNDFYSTAVSLGSSYSIKNVIPKAGYTFDGAYSGSLSGTVASSTKIVLKFSKIRYTVSYNANGGYGAPGPQTKTYGTSLRLSSIVPTRKEHIFFGWSTAPESKTVQYLPSGNYTANANVTLYAVWKRRGDVDGDGSITSTDARMVLQYYAKKVGKDTLYTAAADVDGDGSITSTDARLILQFYAKKITKFPVEK